MEAGSREWVKWIIFKNLAAPPPYIVPRKMAPSTNFGPALRLITGRAPSFLTGFALRGGQRQGSLASVEIQPQRSCPALAGPKNAFVRQ